ncbi:MAG: hypothetical protein GY832_04870, partial [Chloroflexi bacterium]|nr:hypothetical protein [Chloroflexota bacterium]
SFWDLDGRLFDSEPSYFNQHGGAPGDRRGAGQVLDEHAQRGCGSLKSGDGDALWHKDIRQSAAKSDFAAAAWNETAFILDEIIWELGTAGIGRGVGASFQVVKSGWVWARKSQIVFRHGDTTIAVSDDLVQKFWKHERGLGKKPSSLNDIGKAIQRRIDDSSCTPRFAGARRLVRSSLPQLPRTFAREFDGPIRFRTFKAGENVYRSPWVPNELPANPGSWFGTRATSTKQGTDSMLQITKWNNPNEVLRTYEFTQDVTVYYGKVKGGTGYQVLFPKNVTPGDTLKYLGEASLK